MIKNGFKNFRNPSFTFLFISLLLGGWIGCTGGGGGSSSGGGGSPETGGKINLSWASNSEADLAGYRVYYRTSSGVYGKPIDVGIASQSGATTTYSLMKLTKGETYCIVVTAYDIFNNESSFSKEVCATAK